MHASARTGRSDGVDVSVFQTEEIIVAGDKIKFIKEGRSALDQHVCTVLEVCCDSIRTNVAWSPRLSDRDRVGKSGWASFRSVITVVFRQCSVLSVFRDVNTLKLIPSKLKQADYDAVMNRQGFPTIFVCVR